MRKKEIKISRNQQRNWGTEKIMSTVVISHPPFVNDRDMKRSSGDRNRITMNNRADIFCHKINGQHTQGSAALSPICHEILQKQVPRKRRQKENAGLIGAEKAVFMIRWSWSPKWLWGEKYVFCTLQLRGFTVLGTCARWQSSTSASPAVPGAVQNPKVLCLS